MKQRTGRIGLTGTLIVLSLLAASLTTPTAVAQNPNNDEINRDLDQAAQQLAHLMSTPAFRKFLSDETQASANREQILDFGATLAKAQGRPALGLPPGILKKLFEIIDGTKKKMKDVRFEAQFVNLDLYLPVAEHRQKWRGEDNVVVAFAPLGDDTKLTQLTGYRAKDGKPTPLDVKTPPDVPVLVIAPEEHASHQPFAPPKTVAEVPAEPEAPPQDDYVGIAYVKLIDDLEPWIKGNPEVFALVLQANQTTPKQQTIFLPGVDEEGTKYFLGDGPSAPLYFYFDDNYGPTTFFDFWEQDSGATFTVKAAVEYKGASVEGSFNIKDGDDHYGSRYININELSYSGYAERTTGYMVQWFDKDQ